MTGAAKNGSPVRRIASDIVEEIASGALSAERREELVASLVHQWSSYGGHAAIFTDRGLFWLTLSRRSKRGPEVGIIHDKENPLRKFMESWSIDSAQLPLIMHHLNIDQSLEFVNQCGERLRVSINPKERSISVDPISE